MNDRLIAIHSDNPKIHFENPLNLDVLERTMARVTAMRLERLHGVPYSVEIKLTRREAGV